LIRNWFAKRLRFHVHFTPDIWLLAEPGRALVCRAHEQTKMTRGGIDIAIPTYYHARTSFNGSERMRGSDEQTSHIFNYLSPEQRVRPDHPLRAIRRMTDEALTTLSPQFAKMYSDIGRPSIPPEQLLRALVLQSLYTIRSERLLMEEIDYSILFRWFVGMSLDEPIRSPTTFSKNRDRLLEADVASAFFDAVRGQAEAAGLLSDFEASSASQRQSSSCGRRLVETV
jgi:transposase